MQIQCESKFAPRNLSYNKFIATNKFRNRGREPNQHDQHTCVSRWTNATVRAAAVLGRRRPRFAMQSYIYVCDLCFDCAQAIRQNVRRLLVFHSTKHVLFTLERKVLHMFFGFILLFLLGFWCCEGDGRLAEFAASRLAIEMVPLSSVVLA